jgi:hypothetical protein
VVAARAIAYGHTKRKVNLIAAGVDITLADAAPSLEAMLVSDGITGVPIAVPKTTFTDSGSFSYQTDLKTKGITAGYISGSTVYDNAVTVYRTALVNSPKNVDIICIGYLNNMMELLQSPADGISPLTGLELVRAKVGRLWITGGQYPSGTEWNFSHTSQAIAGANYVVSNWPTPIVYSGYEVGSGVVTGNSVTGLQPTDLLAQALVDAGYSAGRTSWDVMGVVLPIVGKTGNAGYTFVRGSNAVDAVTGANTFTTNAGGRDVYVVKSLSDAAFQNIINPLLLKTNWPTYLPYP